MNSITVYVNDATPCEIRPPRDGRDSLEIINDGASALYVAEDTLPTPENAVKIAAASSKAWSKDGTTPMVPQGSVWLLGAAVSPALQKVIVRW